MYILNKISQKLNGELPASKEIFIIDMGGSRKKSKEGQDFGSDDMLQPGPCFF